MLKCSFVIAALGAGMALSAPAFAETMTMTMKVPLSPQSEVPPNTSSGSGNADVTYDTASKKLSWKLSYSNLTGPATMAHFHGPAEAGKNAAVVIPIMPVSSPSEGSATLTDAQAADLAAGKMYINVHTEANKGGEIRGQVVK